MKETKNINVGVDVKQNNSSILYQCIRGCINMRQVKTESNDTFKLRFNAIYETMEISGGDNILLSEQLANNESQTSTKEKQAQID